MREPEIAPEPCCSRCFQQTATVLLDGGLLCSRCYRAEMIEVFLAREEEKSSS